MEKLIKNMACNHDYTDENEIDDIKTEIRILEKRRELMLDEMYAIIQPERTPLQMTEYEIICKALDKNGDRILKLKEQLDKLLENKK